MNTDMELSERWPDWVTVSVQVHYASGPAECKVLSVAPCVPNQTVRVMLAGPDGDAMEMQRLRWVDLPGQSLYLRCLSVLALHWFGSIEMAPRVRGAPLWSSLSLEMTMPSSEGHRMRFDLVMQNETSATLRYQFQRDQPLVSRTVALEPLDADPLRALLRVGASRVKPVAVQRKVVVAQPTRPSLRADSNSHAPSQRV